MCALLLVVSVLAAPQTDLLRVPLEKSTSSRPGVSVPYPNDQIELPKEEIKPVELHKRQVIAETPPGVKIPIKKPGETVILKEKTTDVLTPEHKIKTNPVHFDHKITKRDVEKSKTVEKKPIQRTQPVGTLSHSGTRGKLPLHQEPLKHTKRDTKETLANKPATNIRADSGRQVPQAGIQGKPPRRFVRDTKETLANKPVTNIRPHSETGKQEKPQLSPSSSRRISRDTKETLAKKPATLSQTSTHGKQPLRAEHSRRITRDTKEVLPKKPEHLPASDVGSASRQTPIALRQKHTKREAEDIDDGDSIKEEKRVSKPETEAHQESIHRPSFVHPVPVSDIIKTDPAAPIKHA